MTCAVGRRTRDASAAATRRRIGRGSPRRIGAIGAPSQSSGGASIISSWCCTMCADRRPPASVSSGDASATAITARPPRNAARRPLPKRTGIREDNTHQPRV